MRIMSRTVVFLACATAVLAQAPAGSIAGVARPSGAKAGHPNLCMRCVPQPKRRSIHFSASNKPPLKAPVALHHLGHPLAAHPRDCAPAVAADGTAPPLRL